MEILAKLSAWVLCFGMAYLIACTGTQKLYYPVVSGRTGDRVTVEIERKSDVIIISFPDSILQVGDTVRFYRGTQPVNVKINDKYEEYRSYIIRP